MATLTKPQLAAFMDELLAQADSAAARMRLRYADMPPDSFAKIISGVGYREFYAEMVDEPLALSREACHLVYMLARSTRAQNIVEFGTSFGISTVFMASALHDNGGGRLITTEYESAKIVRARQNIDTAGFTDLVEFRAGDALDTLKQDLPPQIDLLLLDGPKHLYGEVLTLVEPCLRAGAFIVADNADWSPAYLQRVRSRKAGYMSVPFGTDIEVAMRLV